MTTSVPIGTLRFEKVLVHVLLVVHSVEIFQRGFAQMSTFEWLGLVQLALVALVGYLARDKKTWLAWTGAALLFTAPITLIVFLILEARNRKRQEELDDNPSSFSRQT